MHISLGHQEVGKGENHHKASTILWVRQLEYAIREKINIAIDGEIVIENDGFLVFHSNTFNGFYIYSKNLKRLIYTETLTGSRSHKDYRFTDILGDDDSGLYIEVEPELWIHIGKDLESLGFTTQKNSKGENTNLFVGPSNTDESTRQNIADGMHSGGHIPTTYRLANIVGGVGDTDNSQALMLAIIPENTVH